MNSWSWRDQETAHNPDLGLLYEPGNWGDLLKGLWILAIADRFPGNRTDRPLRYLDPFAGAHSYPLVDRSRHRLFRTRETTVGQAQAPWAHRDRMLSSSGLLIERSLQRKIPIQAKVYDSDPDRLASWSDVSSVQALDTEDGWKALERASDDPTDLVLVDPYDLLSPERWPDAVETIGRLVSAGSHILGYLYNRSPKSPAIFNDYRRFRQALESAAGTPPRLVGRVPSDEILPRAWHETFLLLSPTGPPGFGDEWVESLSRQTRSLAWLALSPGCVEDPTWNDPSAPGRDGGMLS